MALFKLFECKKCKKNLEIYKKALEYEKDKFLYKINLLIKQLDEMKEVLRSLEEKGINDSQYDKKE